MASAIIFTIHFLFALIIFTKKWQDDSISAALLNVGLIAILFSVGWTITGMISEFIMQPKGLGILYTRDDFSLSILSIGEYFFYKMYYKDVFTEAGTEKQ